MKRIIITTLGFFVLLSVLSSHAQTVSGEQSDRQEKQAQRLIDVHFEIWNDTDNVARRTRFEQVYARDFSVAEYAGIATGYAEVDRLLSRLQTQHPGFHFTPAPVNWNHGIGRVTWGFGPSGSPNAVRGEDIFTIENGKLASFHVFLEK